MSSYVEWGKEGYAHNVFDVGSNRHYTIPKPKFLFYVQFNITQSGRKFLTSSIQDRRLGFMAKTVDRPTIQYKQEEMNQYNRKRLVTTGVTYGSVNLTLHDTIDETVNKMIQDYNSYYYNDFNQSGQTSYAYDITQGKNNTGTWGYNPKQGASDIYFFTSIDVYEFYNSYYSKWSLMNPKFESVTYSTLDMSSSEGSEITLVVKPEAINYEIISQEITSEVSNLFGIKYQGTTDNYLPNDVEYVGGEGLQNFGTNNDNYTFNIGDPGSFIERAIDLFRGSLVSNLPAAGGGTINNFITNRGVSNLTVGGNVSVGVRDITNNIPRIF